MPERNRPRLQFSHGDNHDGLREDISCAWRSVHFLAPPQLPPPAFVFDGARIGF
jgi:hypothetical protein